jgi:hypothetical protein
MEQLPRLTTNQEDPRQAQLRNVHSKMIPVLRKPLPVLPAEVTRSKKSSESFADDSRVDLDDRAKYLERVDLRNEESLSPQPVPPELLIETSFSADTPDKSVVYGSKR